MSGVGFFSKSINPYPAIPIRYRLPEIVHFKSKNIINWSYVLSESDLYIYKETHEIRRRDELPVWLASSGLRMITSGGEDLNQALKMITQRCKYQFQIRGDNFLKVKHFGSETVIFMIIEVILKN